MPQEDQAHNGQEVLVAGVVRVGPHSIGGSPETLLNRFEVLELAQSLLRSCLCIGLTTVVQPLRTRWGRMHRSAKDVGQRKS